MSEILAPAGGYESAISAINSGADAIYLGLNKFSARSAAQNFDLSELEKICAFAHAFGVKVYVALNTLVKDEELDDFISLAVEAHNTGADALIIQDIFLGKFLKSNFPEIKLHLSTQAGVCNEYGAILAKEYGFDRVILARETTLEDIQRISKIIQTEVFVQGALCTCFSGQCYLSSFIGGNSGNRGKCKQPCRKLYSIDREGFDDLAYRLSLSDLSVGRDIGQYLAAGVTSFKIEGRMRRPEYVAAAVSYYKKIMSGLRAEEEFSHLKRMFNRGNYTKGLAFGQERNFISSCVQGHIGEYAGTIKAVNGKYVLLTSLKFNKKDGFKILRGGKEVCGAYLVEKCNDGYVLASKTRLISGDKAFITTDNQLAQCLLSAKRLLPLHIKAQFFAGERAKIQMGDMLFYGDTPLEKAQNSPLSEEQISQNFKKCDAYPFDCTVEVQTDGVFMQKAALNGFRRKCFDLYFEKITKNINTQYECKIKIPPKKIEKCCDTAIICDNLNDLKQTIGILKPNDYNKNSIENVGNFGGEKYLYLPPYLSGSEIESIAPLVESFDGIYCDGYYGMVLARLWKKKLFAGTGFNITNRLSLSLCESQKICLSKELTLNEADALSGANVFYLVGGAIKVMDLIYCPFERKCSSCDKRDNYILTDEEGRKFPLRRYVTSACRFELYNCACLRADKGLAGRLTDKSISPPAGFTSGHSINGIY